MSNILKESVRGIELIPIDDMLLEESEVFLVGEITPESANNLIKKLMYLNSKDLGEITLYINSPGGEVMSGLAVYDYIKVMKSPVRTVCIGDAASMGAIIFLAGEKREMLSHARILIHTPFKAAEPPTYGRSIAPAKSVAYILFVLRNILAFRFFG